mgnify:CR=1 FL=1
MSNLYLVTGPAGVGKSSISETMASRLKKSAVIEGDTIYNQIVGGYIPAWKEGNHLELFWELSIINIQFYLDKGIDVVFNYIFNKGALEKIVNNINCDNIKFIVLMTDEKTLLKRDSERPEDCQMKDRCVTLLNSFKQKGFGEKFILDTTNLNINQSVDSILKDNRFIIRQGEN